ncbi:MAG: SpoIIIAH-like family protein [Clostridia bacterium]|nr:SpoIIIAH-like family protein [Clostridia bacterium]
MKTKRIIALCVCCLLLAAAIYQNVHSRSGSDNEEVVNSDSSEAEEVIFVQDYNNQEVGNDAESESTAEELSDTEETGVKCDNALDYIAELRIEREVLRSTEAEECMTIIEDTTASDGAKETAQETVDSISTMTEIEDSLESAIKSRGYEDVFVVYDDEGSIDVTVIAKNMTEDEVNSIAEIVHTESGISEEYMSVCSVY